MTCWLHGVLYECTRQRRLFLRCLMLNVYRNKCLVFYSDNSVFHLSTWTIWHVSLLKHSNRNIIKTQDSTQEYTHESWSVCIFNAVHPAGLWWGFEVGVVHRHSGVDGNFVKINGILSYSFEDVNFVYSRYLETWKCVKAKCLSKYFSCVYGVENEVQLIFTLIWMYSEKESVNWHEMISRLFALVHIDALIHY